MWEVEHVLAGRLREHEEQRDLLGYLALISTEYKEGTTLSTLLGRKPLPLDARWAEPDVEDLEDDELDAQDRLDDAEARIALFSGAGYPTGRVTPEEYAQALADSQVL